MSKISVKYDFIFKIVGAGYDINIPGVMVENLEWDLDREIQDFQSLDIGLYPLPDNLWTRGKAGFKAIQYMAVGVPVVASPVGMLKDLIKDGVNGFLAASEEEWIKKISMLIEDPELRSRVGSNGRKDAEKAYSMDVAVLKLADIINKIL
jgi:glycosyltransferase involved in cell wall biosynthesis